MVTCSTHRPRPAAPVRTPEQALEVLGLATNGGRDRVVALACLDRHRRPLAMFIVEDSAAGPAEVIVATDALLDAAADSGGAPPLGAVVLATSRPGGSADPTGLDLDAWEQLDQRFRGQGVTLVDWFVLADGTAVSVGARAGRRSRWSPG